MDSFFDELGRILAGAFALLVIYILVASACQG